MRKLKLRFALPTAHSSRDEPNVLGRTHEGRHILTNFRVLSTTHLLGINAPRCSFGSRSMVRNAANRPCPRGCFRLRLEECFFLLGVIACWYFVGRWLAHRKSPELKPLVRDSRLEGLL